MPYIKQDQRLSVAKELESLIDVVDATNPGELNYVISSILASNLETEGVRYGNVNMLIGVLECAKLELYRRLAAPYEDGKIEENGDVY
jgi:broad-specificity NMP kinase